MDKYDLKKAHKELYTPTAREFSRVDVPEFQYLCIEGQGNPGTAAAYSQALEALYSVSYALKFNSKNTLGRDYVVAPLEGLWWAKDMDVFIARDKDAWSWTMMINQPDWITAAMVAVAVEKAAEKKELPGLKKLQFESMFEGSCVQILHYGSYDDEGPVLKRLHEQYLPENNLEFNGKHHEIYLSDPRRTVPEKLKTILRQPVRPRAGSPVRSTAALAASRDTAGCEHFADESK